MDSLKAASHELQLLAVKSRRRSASQPYAMSDPLADKLQAIAAQHKGDVAATVTALLSETSIWGQTLSANALWHDRVRFWLAEILQLGMLEALASHLKTSGQPSVT